MVEIQDGSKVAGVDTGETDHVFEVVYWPTAKVIQTYDSREEANAAAEWYETTYGPLAHGSLSVRGRLASTTAPEALPESPKDLSREGTE